MRRGATLSTKETTTGRGEAAGEPLPTLIKIPAVEFYLRRARYWS